MYKPEAKASGSFSSGVRKSYSAIENGRNSIKKADAKN